MKRGGALIWTLGLAVVLSVSCKGGTTFLEQVSRIPTARLDIEHPLEENNLDGAEVTVILTDVTYRAGDSGNTSILNREWFIVGGAFGEEGRYGGLSVEAVLRLGDSTARLTLSYSGEEFDETIDDLTVTVEAEALEGYDAPLTTGSAVITAIEEAATISVDTIIDEAIEGGDAGTFRIALVGDATTSDIVVPITLTLGVDGASDGDDGVVDGGWSLTAIAPATLETDGDSGAVTIPVGNSVATLIVNEEEDSDFSDETLTLTIGEEITGGDITVSLAAMGRGQSATMRLLDNDIPPQSASITASMPEAGEPSSDGQFRIGLDRSPLSGALRVHFVVGGNATEGRDYSLSTLTDHWVEIAADTTDALVTVSVLNDDIVETDEEVNLILIRVTDSAGATMPAISVINPDTNVQWWAGVTIADDGDMLTDVAIVDLSDSPQREGIGLMDFTVTATGESERAVALPFAIAHLSTEGSDWRAVDSSPVLLPAGTDPTTTITVTIINDNLVEPEESFSVRLEAGGDDAALYALSSTATEATGIIADNDGSVAVDLELDPVGIVEEHNVGTIRQRVTMKPTLRFSKSGTRIGAPVEIDAVTVTAGSAAVNEDWILAQAFTATSFYFAVGAGADTLPSPASDYVELDIVGDTVVEPDETIRFGATASGEVLGSNAGTIAVDFTIVDDTATALLSTPISLTEANLNGAEVTVALVGTAYGSALTENQFTVEVAGLTVATTRRISDTRARLTLAYDGTDFDTNIDDFRVTVTAAAIEGHSAPLTTNTLEIGAAEHDPVVRLTYFPHDAQPPSESNLNLARVNLRLIDTDNVWIYRDSEVMDVNSITVDDDIAFRLNNAPAGLSIRNVARTIPTVVNLVLSYNGADFDMDIPDFSVTVVGQTLRNLRTSEIWNSDLTTDSLVIDAVVE